MAGLTKQHFNAIAEIVNNRRLDEESISIDLVNDLSSYFKTQNPLFNENQFKKACLE